MMMQGVTVELGCFWEAYTSTAANRAGVRLGFRRLRRGPPIHTAHAAGDRAVYDRPRDRTGRHHQPLQVELSEFASRHQSELIAPLSI
jgi:hypothetical protein